jgi:hypothetical protein
MSTVVKIGGKKQFQGKTHRYIKNESDEFVCEYCDKTSPNQSTISEHISRKHPKESGRQENPFECPLCLKLFNSSSIREQHIQNKHENQRKLCVASGCSYEGKCNASLRTHYVRKHMDYTSLITYRTEDIAMCNNCSTCMKPTTAIYHISTCSPLSPFCKEIVLPVANVVNVLFDLSVSERPSALDNPCAVPKPAKKVLESVVLNSEKGKKVKKEKKEKKEKKVKKEKLIILDSDEEIFEILPKKKIKVKKLKLTNIVFEIIED